MNYPFLIIHGWGRGAKSWLTVKNLLEKKGLLVLAPDLPGFGQNPAPTQAWYLDDYVNWLNHFCEENHLNQFFLLGHSFGGAIALKFSLQYPEKVKKLFLVAPALIRKKSLKKIFLKKIASFLNKFLKLNKSLFWRKFFYRLLRIKSDYLELEGVMKETYLNIIEEDLSKKLDKLSVSTIIIWGKKDNILPVKQAYLIKEKIKDAQIVIIPSANHNLAEKTPAILVEKILENINF